MKKWMPFVIVGIVLIIVILIATTLNKTKQTAPQTAFPTQAPSIVFKDTFRPPDDCSGTPTVAQTEGPYFKQGSQETNYIAQGSGGEELIVTGFVFDSNCKPLKNTKVDFWQADENGEYDLVGFKLRGHQFTDENGIYRLQTIIPKEYDGRTANIHVKITPENGVEITSQIYFPGTQQNETDTIFDETLLMNLAEEQGRKTGYFNFIVE